MVEATILKTFLPGLPWTSLPRQEKVQASKPCWYPSNSFCHARKEKNLKYLYLFSRVPRPFLFIKITPVQCLAPLSTHSGRFVGGGLSRYCGEKGAYASSLPPWSLEQRFCKTLFRSTARSGLSKLKVRMAKATILKTFLQGFPWTSLPRQEKVQASKPFWYPSKSFRHARKEKAPHVLVPIFKGPPALPLHKNHASPMSCPSFHPLRAVCGRELKPILRGKRDICIIFTPWSLEQRFCKTLFRSTARSGLSKLKVRITVRMVEATILKTFLQGFPWTSLPRQEKVQASKPFWYPSKSFRHARKEKAPHVLVPIFKGPPALPLHEKSRQSNISSFHVPLNYSFFEYAQGSASVFLKKAWPVWSPGLPRANPLGEYAQTVVHLEFVF